MQVVFLEEFVASSGVGACPSESAIPDPISIVVISIPDSRIATVNFDIKITLY